MHVQLKANERLLRINWRYGHGKDGGEGTFWFAVSDAIPRGQEEAKLREVIANHYRAVPEGQEERTRAWNPNWGDAINEVDFEGSGFRFLPEPIPDVEIRLDHDELVYIYEE